VPVRGVEDVLVDLVGNDEGIGLLGEAGDEVELGPGEDAAGGIGRVAQNEGLGFLREGAAQVKAGGRSGT
jgi:hypothetical protein